MFGLKNKKAAKITELEDRLALLAKKVEENNHDIGELKGDVKQLKARDPFNKVIHDRLERLDIRQKALRLALLEATKTDE